jgi:hypothetical protein
VPKAYPFGIPKVSAFGTGGTTMIGCRLLLHAYFTQENSICSSPPVISPNNQPSSSTLRAPQVSFSSPPHDKARLTAATTNEVRMS